MSHFSVCVVIPEATAKNLSKSTKYWLDAALSSILAPYEECPESGKFLEFEDRTDSAQAEFKVDTVEAIQYPDGSIKSPYGKEFRDAFILENGKIYARDPSDSKARRVTDASKALVFIPDYPAEKWYKSFDEYCEDYHGYSQNADGRWGRRFNPNAKWDWYEIGGRFQGPFLVKSDLEECVELTEDCMSEDVPEGYKYVNVARKRDICWDMMKRCAVESAKKRYEYLKDTFQTKDHSRLGALETITDEGILGWGYMAFKKDETLEDYLKRKGVTEQDKYQLHTYAFVSSDGNWFSQGDMGWFGVSHNDKPERSWNDDIQELMDRTSDDAYLVAVDCHI